MRKTILVAVTILMMMLTTAAVASGAGSELAALRRATAQFHDVADAEAAGFQSFLDCFDSPSGGMGQHYVDLGRLDDTVDALRPEAMVYEVRDDGRLKLVAVEYIVPNTAPPNGQTSAPTLFGQQFHLNTALNVWVLHAWVWQANPTGTFEDFNRNVGACPAP
ncbi:MAG: hypothetical protein ACRDU9_10775 [Acidimicrobiia bacterium]